MIWIKGTCRVIARVAVAIVVVIMAIVLTQDLQIFPLLLTSQPMERSELPRNVTSHIITTKDGEHIEVWRYLPDNNSAQTRQVAIMFHGNGNDVASSFYLQSWAERNGMESYGFDWRGYGNSSGWPSEKGIYLDSDAVWELMQKNAPVSPEHVVLLGQSLGTGPASYLAHKHQVGVLILISPYTSIPDVIRGRGIMGWLAPFSWYEFPVLNYLKNIKSRCIITVHGRRDNIIPFTHSQKLKDAFGARENFKWLFFDEYGHNDLFHKADTALSAALRQCSL